MEGTLGEIRLFAGDFAPQNWEVCAGQKLPIAKNQALYSLLGKNFGGDGKTDFALPDLRGRVAAHPNNPATPLLPAVAFGQAQGSVTTTLTALNLPMHNHAVYCNNQPAAGTLNTPSGNFISAGPVNNTTPVNLRFARAASTANNLMNANTVLNTGASTPYSNMMPSTTLNYIICVNGFYPTRD